MTTGEWIILIVWVLLMAPMIVKSWVEAYRAFRRRLTEEWNKSIYKT